MGWTKNDRFDFSAKVKAYWPTMKENQGEFGTLLNLYADKLQGWKFDRVLTALENLKAGGSRFVPEIPEIQAECKKLSSDQTRDGYVNRLKAIANPSNWPAYWISPKGVRCEIANAGLIFKRQDGSRGTLLWSQLETADLEAILFGNEREIKYEPPMPWKEFVASGGVEQVIDRMEARGEDASFLRENLPSWRKGAELVKPVVGHFDSDVQF